MKDAGSGGEERSYTFTYVGPPEHPPGWVDGVPTSGRGQSCVFCGGPRVAWVHPLNSGLVQYQAYGKGHTLPTFWTLCERCESVYRAGDDEVAVELMKVHMEGFWETDDDVEETIRKPIAVCFGEPTAAGASWSTERQATFARAPAPPSSLADESCAGDPPGIAADSALTCR
jgi:hypothetical protein